MSREYHKSFCDINTGRQCSCNAMEAGKPGATPEVDLVNHPPHYKTGNMEVIDIIENFQLPYHLGNTIKYILRAGKKGTQEDMKRDIKKAQWYLNRYIEKHGG